MNETIYIIGNGAVGKTLAACLQDAGKPVMILRGRFADTTPVIENIRVIEGEKVPIDASVMVSSIDHVPNFNGPIVITTKSFGNARLAQVLQAKAITVPIILLQNGLNVERPFIDHGFTSIYRCVLFMTSQINDFTVNYKPVAASPIGMVSQNARDLQGVVDRLHTSHFPFLVETNIEKVVWKKAIVNCVFNSVCTLLHIDNGIFHRNAAALAIAKRVIQECVAIAQASNVALTEAEITESLLLISQRSDGQLISTLQDVLHQRPTEIDTLNLEIAAIAKVMHKEHLVKETTLLGELVKLKSSLSMQYGL